MSERKCVLIFRLEAWYSEVLYGVDPIMFPQPLALLQLQALFFDT